MEEPSHAYDLADEQRDQNHPHQRSVIPRDRMRNRPIDRERYGEDSYQQCCDIQGEEPMRELVACLTQRRVCHSRRLPLGNSPDHFGPLRTVVTRPIVQGIWTAIRLQPGPQDLCTPKLTRDPSAPARRTRPLILSALRYREARRGAHYSPGPAPQRAGHRGPTPRGFVPMVARAELVVGERGDQLGNPDP